jgi:hypothetical protein
MTIAPTTSRSLATNVGRGVLAGVAGSVVMTAFQKLIEMPITGREDSHQPAKLAQKLLPVQPSGAAELKRLNYAAHTTLGAMWGAAYGVAAHQGLRGPRAVAATFAAIYTQDVVMGTALGLGKPPWQWSRQEWTIDIVDKLVNVAATGRIFDRVLGPAATS